jgi:YesN/AraC family two-component response regulator
MIERLSANLEATLLKTYSEVVSEQNSAEDAAIRISKQRLLPDILKAARQEFLLLGSRTQAVHISSRHEQLRYEIMKYIHKKYADILLSVSSIAQQFHLSEPYFSQLFKVLMGTSFSCYLETVRLTKAQELLRGKTLTVEQIAREVGYTNSTTFRRAFKRMAGISPTTFRRNPSDEELSLGQI